MQSDAKPQASEPLLRDFDKTAELVRSFVVGRYGEEGKPGARDRYGLLHFSIPQSGTSTVKSFAEIVPRSPQTGMI